MSTKGEEVCLFLDRTMKLAIATGMMTKKREGEGVGGCVRGQPERGWAGMFRLGDSLGRLLSKLIASVHRSPTCWLAVPS